MPLRDSESHALVALFESVLAAINAGDWELVADACDAASLQEFRDRSVACLTSVEDVPTVEGLLHDLPGLPPSEAEKMVVQQREMNLPQSRLRFLLPWLSTVAEAESLPPRDFLMRALQGKTPPARIARMAADGELSAPEVASALARSVLQLRFTALGAVLESENSACIAYRLPRHDWTHDPGALRWLGNLPEGGRELYEDLGGHVKIRLERARRQTDGSWRLVAHEDLAGASSFSVNYLADDGHEVWRGG